MIDSALTAASAAVSENNNFGSKNGNVSELEKEIVSLDLVLGRDFVRVVDEVNSEETDGVGNEEVFEGEGRVLEIVSEKLKPSRQVQ